MFSKAMLTILSCISALSMSLMGCSSSLTKDVHSPQLASASKDSSKTGVNVGNIVTLSVLMNVATPAGQNIYKAIALDFERANPAIKVDIQFPAEYESLLKVKMAASDLPDVFDTHGWAQIRYGKYLTDLRNESWASQLSDTIRDIVTDKQGKVYVLPISEAKDGISYNVSVLKKYKIEVPKTFDELMAASEKILTESKGEVVPFYFSGADNWTVGEHFDLFAIPQLISSKNNEANALLNGSFDWSKWTPLAAKFKEMFDKGYINKDIITAKFADLAKLFATDKIAFFDGGPNFAEDTYKLNKDAQIGIMPIPSIVVGDSPTFSGGERDTMGIWKNTKHMTEAKKLLAFYAQPDNLAKIAKVMKLPVGLKGVTVNHEFAKYYEQYRDIRVFPYFDRVYLPNGMWDIMCTNGLDLIAGHITAAEFSIIMKENVTRLAKR